MIFLFVSAVFSLGYIHSNSTSVIHIQKPLLMRSRMVLSKRINAQTSHGEPQSVTDANLFSSQSHRRDAARRIRLEFTNLLVGIID